nr:MAG TPA: hypothetical protein [Caudoviricetes sp.]
MFLKVIMLLSIKETDFLQLLSQETNGPKNKITASCL